VDSEKTAASAFDDQVSGSSALVGIGKAVVECADGYVETGIDPDSDSTCDEIALVDVPRTFFANPPKVKRRQKRMEPRAACAPTFKGSKRMGVSTTQFDQQTMGPCSQLSGHIRPASAVALASSLIAGDFHVVIFSRSTIVIASLTTGERYWYANDDEKFNAVLRNPHFAFYCLVNVGVWSHRSSAWIHFGSKVDQPRVRELLCRLPGQASA
jgi:hypothetical protein